MPTPNTAVEEFCAQLRGARDVPTLRDRYCSNVAALLDAGQVLAARSLTGVYRERMAALR